MGAYLQATAVEEPTEQTHYLCFDSMRSMSRFGPSPQIENILTLTLLWTLTVAAPATGEWATRGPVGRLGAQVEVSPADGGLYALSNEILYRSTDGAATWLRANHGLEASDVRLVRAHPAEPETVFASTYSDGLFKSNEGGGSWHRLTLGNNGPEALAIDRFDGNTLYAAHYRYGLKRSDDGGMTWHELDAHRDFEVLVVSPHSEGTVFGGFRYGGLFKSTDRGQTWTELLNRGVVDLALDPSTPSLLYVATYWDGTYRSEDGGVTWTSLGRPAPSLGASRLLVDAGEPDRLYAASERGVYRSDDRGNTWTEHSKGLETDDPYGAGRAPAPVRSLAQQPGDPPTFYIAVEGEAPVYRSHDRATTWSPTSRGISSLETLALAIDPQTPSTLYAGRWKENGVELLRSADSGATWIRIDEELPRVGAHSYIAVHPTDPLRLFTSIQVRAGPAGPFPCDVYRSVDGGTSWQRVIERVGWISGIHIPLSAPSTIYLDAQSLYRSRDGGDTWDEIWSALPAVTALAVDPLDGDRLLAVARDGWLYLSTDGGDSWGSVSRSFGLSAVTTLILDPDVPGQVYVGGYDGSVGAVQRSRDGGRTWKTVFRNSTSSLVTNIALGGKRSRTVYAVVGWSGDRRTGCCGVVISRDGGSTWRWHNQGLPSDWVERIAVDPLNPSIVYASGVGVSRRVEIPRSASTPALLLDQWPELRLAWPSDTAQGTFAADDFLLEAPARVVRVVFWGGWKGGPSGGIRGSRFSVQIWGDGNDEIFAERFGLAAISRTLAGYESGSGAPVYRFVLALREPINLRAGHHWIGVQHEASDFGSRFALGGAAPDPEKGTPGVITGEGSPLEAREGGLAIQLLADSN